jgi:hypothetical protein
METWMKDNILQEHQLMFDHNEGDPFWIAVVQEEDATVFVLRFYGVIS